MSLADLLDAAADALQEREKAEAFAITHANAALDKLGRARRPSKVVQGATADIEAIENALCGGVDILDALRERAEGLR